MDFCVLLNLVLNKKPEASYTGCPKCVHLWRTLNELLWTFYEHFLRKISKFDNFPPKGPRYAQNMVGMGKSGVWKMDFCVLLNLVQIRSFLYRLSELCPLMKNIIWTFMNILWTFSKKNVKIWWFSSKCWRTCVFSAFSFLPAFSSSKYEPLIKSIIFLYSHYLFPFNSI